MSSIILVVCSETPDQRAERRRYAGQASHESYATALRRLRPGISLETMSCLEEGAAPDPARHTGIIFAGSPIQMHKDSPETRAAARFMTQVFQTGVPSFGSCAGLQIAAVAAGGATGPRRTGAEFAFARDITRTDAGLRHPVLDGRPATWTAPAMHQADDIIDQGLARDQRDLRDMTARLRDLDASPTRSDLAWQLGLNAEIAAFDRRTLEIANFLDAVDKGRLRSG